MTSPSLYGGYGALAFPITLPVGIDVVDALDPGQYSIANLLKAAINAELGVAWKQICNRLSEGHHLVRENALPVAEIVDQEPSPALMGQRFAGWPVLAVYREGEPKTSGYNLYETQTEQQWAVDWVAGPLDAGDQSRIGKFALAVASIVRATIEVGFHPAYQNGVRQFFGQFYRIDAIGQQGPGVAHVLGDEKGNGYYGVSILLQSVEFSVRTVGAAVDVTNKWYDAFKNAPAGIPVTSVRDDGTIDNQTPDPVTP
jgi:hypothetical protein